MGTLDGDPMVTRVVSIDTRVVYPRAWLKVLKTGC